MHKKRNTLGGLIALNLALVVILGLVTFAPSVQASGAAAAAGDYMIVGGRINGATSNAVYILDQRTGALMCFLYDRSTKKLKGLSVRSVANDAKRFSPSR
ncbi:MAG: hypothetical protein KJZ69_07675 [Phycisphaerales bacterium]|nr:hypothetical protein [Phycisphaerales bacterium]